MDAQVYKEIKTLHFPNMIVRVHIPDLTHDEQIERQKQVHNAAVKLLREGQVVKTA